MKVVAFNGSPRKNGNTAAAIRVVLAELEAQGIETEFVQVGGELLAGCKSCRRCLENDDCRCVQTGDAMNGFIAKMLEADGIIIGSPVYFSNVSTEIKALIDRAGYAVGQRLKHKVGAAVVCSRRAGCTFTYAAINFFFGIKQMIIPSSTYWNLSLSRDVGDLEKDEEGIRTFKTLGENMAYTLRQLQK